MFLKHSWKKRKKVAQTETSREEIAEKQKLEICLKIALNTIKNMFEYPKSLKVVYSSIL